MTTLVIVWERTKIRAGCHAGFFLQLLFKCMMSAPSLSVASDPKSTPKLGASSSPSFPASPAATTLVALKLQEAPGLLCKALTHLGETSRIMWGLHRSPLVMHTLPTRTVHLPAFLLPPLVRTMLVSYRGSSPASLLPPPCPDNSLTTTQFLFS